MITFISAYLFYVGFSFRRGAKRRWNPALQMLIGRMGTYTMIFAPLSTVIYIVLHFHRGEGIPISLDFFYLALWSVVSLGVVLHYLTRLGTIPDKTTVDREFITRYGISPREAEVIELILKGYTNKKIGDELFISFTTARTHVSHVFEKTGVKSRVELVAKIVSE